MGSIRPAPSEFRGDKGNDTLRSLTGVGGVSGTMAWYVAASAIRIRLISGDSLDWDIEDKLLEGEPFDSSLTCLRVRRRSLALR